MLVDMRRLAGACTSTLWTVLPSSMYDGLLATFGQLQIVMVPLESFLTARHIVIPLMGGHAISSTGFISKRGYMQRLHCSLLLRIHGSSDNPHGAEGGLIISRPL